MTELGRLESVDLRAIWQSEAGAFTPWLAQPENLKLLGEAIGIELELEAQEKSVGPFRADILCKDIETDNWVLIENQLETTDHVHLGQLLTYASGLKAVTIVWIARKFTEEHRAALDWLNEITDDRFTFFGLEVELWRIGDSPCAPKFNVVSKPNDWAKSVSAGTGRIDRGELTEAKAVQLEFWTAFRAFVEARGSTIKPTKPLPRHWMNFALNRSGFRLSAVASFWDSVIESYASNEVRASVIIRSEDAKLHFQQLEADRGAIESEMGEPLTWHNPEGKRMCRISVRRTADLQDRSKWPEYHLWLITKLEALQRVFAPRVKALPKGLADDDRPHTWPASAPPAS